MALACRIFIFAVTSEFGKARDEIANDLSARGLLVKVQRQFRQEADTETTLAKLNKYISDCFAVVHIAGARSGGFPGEDEAKPFRDVLPSEVARASYTQWEFHLARHHKRRLSIYIARLTINLTNQPRRISMTLRGYRPSISAAWRNWIAIILRRPISFAVASFEKTGQR